MKTQSMLKMLLVATLFVSPVVMAADEVKTEAETTTTAAATPATPAATPAAATPEATEGIIASVKSGFATAGATAYALPTDVYNYVNKNRMTSAIVAYIVYKEAKAYFTAPARAN